MMPNVAGQAICKPSPTSGLFGVSRPLVQPLQQSFREGFCTYIIPVEIASSHRPNMHCGILKLCL